MKEIGQKGNKRMTTPETRLVYCVWVFFGISIPFMFARYAPKIWLSLHFWQLTAVGKTIQLPDSLKKILINSYSKKHMISGTEMRRISRMSPHKEKHRKCNTAISPSTCLRLNTSTYCKGLVIRLSTKVGLISNELNEST